MEPVWLLVPMNPEPWAIGPVAVRRFGGKIAGSVGRNQQLHAYKEGVAEHVRALWGDRPMLTGRVKITFYFWRQRSEYKTAQSRSHRKHEADATNLLKACEDALQGIVFANDRDNTDVRAVVVDQDAETVPLILIKVERATAKGFLEDAVPIDIQRQVIKSMLGPIPGLSSNVNGPPEGF